MSEIYEQRTTQNTIIVYQQSITVNKIMNQKVKSITNSPWHVLPGAGAGWGQGGGYSVRVAGRMGWGSPG